MLTHANVLMNAFYVGQRLRYTAADRVCVPVPFYHCFGCVLGNLVCAVYGAAMVVPAPAFDPGGDARCNCRPSNARRFTACLRCSCGCSTIPTSPHATCPACGPGSCRAPLSAAADGEGRQRDGSARDLDRLRPDRGLADHHLHLGGRPASKFASALSAGQYPEWRSDWSTR